MDKPIYGYAGKQLRISLNNRKVTVENIDPKVLRKYIGGTGGSDIPTIQSGYFPASLEFKNGMFFYS
jgi:hypothetical protein